MFVPSEFDEQRCQEIETIISKFPLSTVVANGKEGLMANHLPLLLDRKLDFAAKNDCFGRFIGHVSRRNNMHRNLVKGQDVLVIFRSEDSYISPNWYPTKAEHHRHVPTWNYQAVHFHGTIQFSDDLKFLRRIVGTLTKYFESRNQGNKAWKMADAPSDFMSQKLAGIVGFEIEVYRCLAKSKLGQNKDKADFENVRREMVNHDKVFLARSMSAIDESGDD
jgi:transcriptional regulator